MSASRPGNMRGLWVKTPLLLLLLLLTTLSGTVLCQSEDYDENTETEAPETDGSDPAVDTEPSEPPSLNEATSQPYFTEESAGDGEDTGSGTLLPAVDPSAIISTIPPEDDEQNLGVIIIPLFVGLVVIIIGLIVLGIFISRGRINKTRNQELRKEDPYLDGSNTEKVPMPMFEEDVPSVLELEMEELDQWMKKDGETAEDSKNA
ncbi:transmembrane protein 154 isoform X2 [Seriola lalandi dorsalis]|uniref:transmembrane protein 154 isoform X2 n=1 Tax=Seriola lalandi dorsalis TaxID=1841481 RepID=UPI000C6FBDA8|nr:transmembrane protein 154 isoform X2 [Seriola lalandi dorsalis]XP_056227289.1 transmembrane protein 154 isoform X2 [Seriola aureovittata]